MTQLATRRGAAAPERVPIDAGAGGAGGVQRQQRAAGGGRRRQPDGGSSIRADSQGEKINQKWNPNARVGVDGRPPPKPPPPQINK